MLTSVFVSLDLVRIPIGERLLNEVECTRCDATLDIHQPDEELSARLLGACPNCRAWHLIDADAGLMAVLPDETDLRNA
jgi:hypothetical protein